MTRSLIVVMSGVTELVLVTMVLGAGPVARMDGSGGDTTAPVAGMVTVGARRLSLGHALQHRSDGPAAQRRLRRGRQ